MESIRRIVHGYLNNCMISSFKDSRDRTLSVVSTTVTSVLEDLGNTGMVLSEEGNISIAAKCRRIRRKNSRRVMATADSSSDGFVWLSRGSRNGLGEEDTKGEDHGGFEVLFLSARRTKAGEVRCHRLGKQRENFGDMVVRASGRKSGRG